VLSLAVRAALGGARLARWGSVIECGATARRHGAQRAGQPAGVRRFGSVVVLPVPAFEPAVEPVAEFGAGHRPPPGAPTRARLCRIPRRPSTADAVPEVVDRVPEPLPAALNPDETGRDARVLAMAVVEVLLGRRPARQVRPCVDRHVFRALAGHTVRHGHGDVEPEVVPPARFGANAAPRRMQTSFPSERAAETFALVQDGPRLRMLVLRCDLRDRPSGPRWQCTYLRLG
jgi:hypothetical protein